MRPLPLLTALLLPATATHALALPHFLQKPLHAIMPPSPDDAPPSRQPAVCLADILGTQRALTTFSGMVRNSSPVESRLSDRRTNTTVLAPLNSAIDRLPHKPWESPADYHGLGASAYEGDEGKERADRNLRRFVEAHLVTVSPWAEGKEKGAARTVEGAGGARELWWEEKEGKRVIMPDGVEVERVASQVANGELVSTCLAWGCADVPRAIPGTYSCGSASANVSPVDSQGRAELSRLRHASRHDTLSHSSWKDKTTDERIIVLMFNDDTLSYNKDGTHSMEANLQAGIGITHSSPTRIERLIRSHNTRTSFVRSK